MDEHLKRQQERWERAMSEVEKQATLFALIIHSRLRESTLPRRDDLLAALDAEKVVEQEWIEAAESAGETEAAGRANFMRAVRGIKRADSPPQS